jgi:hypothetical protein
VSRAVWALDIKTETTTATNYLSAGAEYSQFAFPTGTIHGSGIRAGFSHYFSEKFDIDVFLASALGAQGSVGSSSFTGIGGYVYYTVSGNCCAMRKTISSMGVPILRETRKKQNSFKIGAGLDQFFLNGTAAVYSISGLGAGAKYQFGLFNYNFEAAARYSVMSANGVGINGIFISIGMIFDL